MPNQPLKPDKVDMSVNLGGLQMKNPVCTASGTFGYGSEYIDYFDPALLGAVIVKGTTMEPRAGNPPPRIVETPAGMLNAIGLENPGVEAFISQYMPELRAQGVTVVANIAGNTLEEYGQLAQRLDHVEGIAALELNISCPNVKQGGLQFGTDPDMVYQVVNMVKSNTQLPVIPKLSPNVTDIVAIASAAQEGGADALAMINTLMGMAVDIDRCRPTLANIFGGLSGPAIKPVALRMIYQVYQQVKLPILGGGGIVSVRDALEFMMVGASAVSIGTGIFVDPYLPCQVIDGLQEYAAQHGLASIKELVGAAHQE
ncbi:MAG: dihydroorotate dehydrogenase [Bacillota bacterium]|jgi:dihydroorotate dehydrogenase (NAD+) catalytic subunit|nr:dihydroorotate dehydrogenase [Bacillota bacterium]NLP23411.1 dihydroorotate dehydrogenase [Syntrophomonadaceae bacterium]